MNTIFVKMVLFFGGLGILYSTTMTFGYSPVIRVILATVMILYALFISLLSPRKSGATAGRQGQPLNNK